MRYVIGVDLGTSSVKVVVINKDGEVCGEVTKEYPLIQLKDGYREQDPNEWVTKTAEALKELVDSYNLDTRLIDGISFSGQMHGLVLLDEEMNVIRNAILWNDTRTTEQCKEVYELVGNDLLLKVTKNPALEGFTLPKLLWVKKYEPELFSKTNVFMLPKDYVRYKMTGKINSEYSDAAGTLLLNVIEKKWSEEMCQLTGIPIAICPPLVESQDYVGQLTSDFANRTGLQPTTNVYAGGADNACGAIGASILESGKTLCSIGTSGVVLSYEESKERVFDGKVHYFNHGKKDAYYTMGVTLSAGHSLQWFRDTFAENKSFEGLLEGLSNVPIGANGLLFTPYLVGERTPYADSNIRGSFIGIDATHQRIDFARAVIEGITFSLRESVEMFRSAGKSIDTIIAIGGGSKNETWLQLQADVFNATIVKLKEEQGCALGAAMLASVGCGWFESLEECAERFIKFDKFYEPIQENVDQYNELFSLYKTVYAHTNDLSKELKKFRNQVNAEVQP
ncbi:xylulokinase [Bacillus sp. BGMRC 2118]|nr:xylulokinase [Bacillus sp. BGMRC 2118]